MKHCHNQCQSMFYDFPEAQNSSTWQWRFQISRFPSMIPKRLRFPVSMRSVQMSAWLGKHLGYNGESECEALWMSYGSLLPKTSHQVWSGPSWSCVCPSSLLPFTPTQTHLALWCLCAFVNEEILVPGWDIAVSWATPAFCPVPSYIHPPTAFPNKTLQMTSFTTSLSITEAQIIANSENRFPN